MKGIIFNLLEEVVTSRINDSTWDDILDETGADGAYTSLGNYPDHEFVALLTSLAKHRKADPQELLSWFGRQSMPLLAARYPEFFSSHRRLRSFLLSLNEVIHSEVRKLYPGADVPVFQFNHPAGSSPDDPLVIHYRSERKLCHLAEGFIHGAADHFGESVRIEQQTCMHRGDAECTIACGFQAKK